MTVNRFRFPILKTLCLRLRIRRSIPHLRRPRTLFATMCVCGMFLATELHLIAATSSYANLPIPNPFFVFDNGLNDDTHATLAAKASLLQELGYNGVGWRPGQITKMRQELEQRQLKMFTCYVGAKIGAKQAKYDPDLPSTIAELRGTGAIIWLTLTSDQDPPSSPEGDERAVRVVSEIAELASAAGLRVALYPHHAFWLEKVEDAVRVVRKVDRPDVGVSFNLCHCLRAGNERRIPTILREAAPYLWLVSINGADSEGKDWGTLIQSLDQGSFDLLGLLKDLHSLNYSGPIGLQCYGIGGDVRDNLTRSMKAWRRLSSR